MIIVKVPLCNIFEVFSWFVPHTFFILQSFLFAKIDLFQEGPYLTPWRNILSQVLNGGFSRRKQSSDQ